MRVVVCHQIGKSDEMLCVFASHVRTGHAEQRLEGHALPNVRELRKVLKKTIEGALLADGFRIRLRNNVQNAEAILEKRGRTVDQRTCNGGQKTGPSKAASGIVIDFDEMVDAGGCGNRNSFR
jgi:hypothetical protein